MEWSTDILRVWLSRLSLIILSYQTILADAQCTQGAVRLSQSSTSYNTPNPYYGTPSPYYGTSSPYYGTPSPYYWYTSGYVEICSLGQWGRVCGRSSNNFGSNEAKVICRQLGYSDRGAVGITRGYSYRSSSTILLTRGLDCRGDETSWLDCNLQPRYSSTCRNGNYNYNAAVQCSQAPTLQVSITTVPTLTSGIVVAGTSLRMTCVVSPYTTGIETYHWSSTCTGSCFVRGASTQTIHRDVLHVSDSGRHTCTVTRGTSNRQSSPLTLTVVEPKITLSMSSSYSGIDSPPYNHFTLWCNASTQIQMDLPTVLTWYKDGVAIDGESEWTIVETVQSKCSDRNCSALIVNDAVVGSSGEYMCVASIEVPGSRTISEIAKTNVAIHGTTEAIIQLHLTGVHHCKDWVFIEAHEKAADISELLTQAIEERCDCDFTLERLEDSGLVCTVEDLNEIVYQTRILSTPKATSHRIAGIVAQIISTEGQTFVVRGLRLTVVQDCAVLVDSFIDVSCGGGADENDMLISASGIGGISPHSQTSTGLTAIAIVEGIVIFVAVVATISVCVICVLFVRRYRKWGRFTRLTNHPDVSFERDSGVNISGGLHFRPTAPRAESDIYEELPLKTDQDEI